MTEEQKVIFMYEQIHGKLSTGTGCSFEYCDETGMLTCMKDGYECWSVSKYDVLFDYLTKDIK